MEMVNENSIEEEVAPETTLYTEKATRLLYEVQFYDDFVLVRPASPFFYAAIAKMPYAEFENDYEEFAGDHGKVKKYIEKTQDEIYSA